MCNSILESSSKIHETHSYLSSHCEAEFAKRRIVHPPKRTWAGLMCKSRIIKGLTTVFLLCCVCVIINWFDLLRSGKAVAVFRRMIQRHPRPVFPLSYHSTGLLRLPHSGIKEPFEIWLSHKDQKSRVDFYYGKCTPDFAIWLAMDWCLSYYLVSEFLSLNAENEINCTNNRLIQWKHENKRFIIHMCL